MIDNISGPGLDGKECLGCWSERQAEETGCVAVTADLAWCDGRRCDWRGSSTYLHTCLGGDKRLCPTCWHNAKTKKSPVETQSQ